MSATTITLPKTKFELEFNQGSVYSDEDREAVLRVLQNNAPSCGNEVLAFEKEFAEFTTSKYAIAVGNATQGLEIAVRAALTLSKLTNRTEVIVPSVSWISTASSAVLAGATIKFADIVDLTICIDVESVKRLVCPNTAAVIVVHLFGRPVDGLIELAAWLKVRNIMLIEDCAHSIGATDSSGAVCGTIGDIGVFSFHQQKNMVTLGEGGMCVTSDLKLRDLLVGYRSLCAKSYDPKGKYLAIDPGAHPMDHRYWMIDFVDHGHNFRMLDIQAAVGRVQLNRVRGWNDRRGKIAQMLSKGLKNIHPGLKVAEVDELYSTTKRVHSWHVFHVLVTDEFPLPKESFMWAMLEEFGIKVWNHYSPMHLSTAFRSSGLCKVGDCPVAEALFEQYVSLPIHPRLTDEAVHYLIDAIKQLSARPYVTRLSNAPLLRALLSLSEPGSNVVPSNSDSTSAVCKQMEYFRNQVLQAIQDCFFHTPAAQDQTTIHISRAPGRLDLMGGNDDYTGGLVFECTIAEATFVAAQTLPSTTPTIIIRNRQLTSNDIKIPVSILQKPGFTPEDLASYLKESYAESRWPLYVVGVLYWLNLEYQSKMFNKTSLSLLIWGDVPLNRGVSSSASVEVAVMKAAAHAFGISLSGEKLATACQWVENQVCSSACGLMDQMAVTLGSPFMAMKCQPACICEAPPLPSDLTVYALDSGVSHEVSGIEYEAARAAAFMGYTDSKYYGYLANMSPSEFARKYENILPEQLLGRHFAERYGIHVDPATPLLPDHVYNIRANTKYAVLENNRVTNFCQLLLGCQNQIRKKIDVYQSHDAYTECGLGSSATSLIVDLVRELGPSSGLYGAKITGGGAGGTVAILGLASACDTFKNKVVAEYAKRRCLTQFTHVFVGSSPGADAFGVLSFA